MSSEKVLAIDIGGTSIKAAIVNEEGKISDKYVIDTIKSGRNPEFIESLLSVFNHFIDNKIEFSKVGIGCVGPMLIDQGMILKTANIPQIKDIQILKPIKENLKKRLGRDFEVFLDNDSSIVALGQFKYGIGIGKPNLIILTLGTGIGGGLLINGKLFSGFNGNGFEIGHIPMHPGNDWRQEDLPIFECGCSAMGCLETYASATGISKYYHFFSKTKENFSANQIYQKAKEGDSAAIKTFRLVGECLGLACTTLGHLFNPSLIVVTGGVAAASDLITPRMNEVLQTRLFPVLKDRLEVKFTNGDENYGILGAAALCHSERILLD